MDKKDFQQQRKLLLEEGLAQDSAAEKGRRIAAALMWLWVISRLVFLVLQLICIERGYIIVEGSNLTSTVMCVLFAICIARGARLFAFLPAIGGFTMILGAFSLDAYAALSPMYLPIVRIYSLSYILAGWLQLICLALVLLLPCCKAYYELVKTVTETLTAKSKGS